MSGRAYYQTTPLTTEQLTQAFREAGAQDDLVLAVYRTAATIGTGLLSPSQVHAAGRVRGSQWLLTSVRRSIATLTEAGVLFKTDTCRMGPHGRPEYCWRLAENVKAL
jgi:hypothetical protein